MGNPSWPKQSIYRRQGNTSILMSLWYFTIFQFVDFPICCEHIYVCRESMIHITWFLLSFKFKYERSDAKIFSDSFVGARKICSVFKKNISMFVLLHFYHGIYSHSWQNLTWWFQEPCHFSECILFWALEVDLSSKDPLRMKSLVTFAYSWNPLFIWSPHLHHR